jgi:hypothetical protein
LTDRHIDRKSKKSLTSKRLSAQKLNNPSHSLHILHGGWSWPSGDPYWFWSHLVKRSRFLGPLLLKACPLNCLLMLWSKVFIFVILRLVMTSRWSLLIFKGTVSKSKVTWAFTTIRLCVQMLKSACPQCIDFHVRGQGHRGLESKKFFLLVA